MSRAAFSRREPVESPAPVVATQTDDSYVIRLEEPLDTAACRELELRLAEAEASGAPRILLDVDDLESLDASALHVILRASRRSAGGRGRLRITRGNGYVAEIFRLTALDRTLPFDD